jgi:hypothetical protein
MTAVHVRRKLMHEISLMGNPGVAVVPEVVVRVANGKVRLQRRFLSQSKPVIASEWHIIASVAGICGAMIPQTFTISMKPDACEFLLASL